MSDNHEEDDAITQARINSQTEYDRIQEEAQDKLDEMDRSTQEAWDSLSQEERDEATASMERLDQASIRDFGAPENERWEQAQDQASQSFVDDDGRNVVVDRLVRGRYTIPTQEVLDEAKPPSLDDEC
jgi:hypothetical protein